MASVLDLQQWLSPVNAAFAIGLALVCGVLLQVLVQLYGFARRLGFERQQHALARERLQLSIKAAWVRCQEAEQARLVWNGFRKFRIARKVRECQDVHSFYLAPHDNRPIPAFKPGQYLTFQLHMPGQSKPVIRCYSISDAPRSDNHFRVTIKKQAPPKESSAPPGLASTFFNDHLQEGDILDVKAPAGAFFLDLTRPTPVVLISGGVGITPMLSMLNALLAAGSKREIWFFHGARNGREHIQKDFVRQVASEHEYVHLHVSYSSPGPDDVLGQDYHEKGYFSLELLQRLLPSNTFEFFICGPPKMMEDTAAGLAAWDVPKSRIHYEAFGAPTVKKMAPAAVGAGTQPTATLQVTFSRCGKVVPWKPSYESLLDLAEAHGIEVPSGCRAGSCGTCLVAMRSGQVTYPAGHVAPGEEGSCLACVSKPQTDLVLDL